MLDLDIDRMLSPVAGGRHWKENRSTILWIDRSKSRGTETIAGHWLSGPKEEKLHRPKPRKAARRPAIRLKSGGFAAGHCPVGMLSAAIWPCEK